ncbi:Serine carboxypeptidase 1 [Vitis vinifera]|uniref:Carboxypeptidase n=1 Tax=Vitis vinifera TaxID=29760 RepID=A0A438GD57_VITVI|nr:Serine carboxypeptidase 1 [Vitis vinifera]
MAMASFYLFTSSLCILFSFVVFTEAAPKGLSSHTFLGSMELSLPSTTQGGEPAKNLFYYFVVSERNPGKDPLVLWLNGGPGCSSFDGFVYEHGPFNFEAGKTPNSLPTLHLNPYSWSKVSSMIYLDSPAGVGFFILENTWQYNTGDLQTASDTHEFLLRNSPNSSPNPFYVSGESYAGVYVPTLSAAIVKGIKSGAKPTINFKGYLVGNGVTDMEFDANALVPFTHGMGLISIPKQLVQKARDNCGGNYYSNESKSCIEELNKIYNDDQVASVWLNDKGVRTAIHAQQKDVIGEWEICTGRLYYSSDSGMGINDMCVPFTGSEAWTRSLDIRLWMNGGLGFPMTKLPGTHKDMNMASPFSPSSGHTVPEYKPKEALDFFQQMVGRKSNITNMEKQFLQVFHQSVIHLLA